LLTKDRQIRLIDFGTARDLQHPEIKGAGNGSTPRRVYEHYIGTPNYMAPECIRNKDSNMKSDVYSLGSVFFQLFTGFPAFTGPSEYLIFKMSLEQKPPKIVGVIPEEVYELICLMTEKDFTKRISIEEIKRHPFFEKVDFEKNLSFEEAAKSFRPVEKLLTEIKEEVLQSSKLKKEELEAAISKTISSKIKEANSLEEKEKKEFEDRLRFLRRQLKHFYEIEEIEFFKF
jgi:serine/threonine protein kinase